MINYAHEFIRLSTKRERGNPTRSLASLPVREGWTKVYMPYGKQGRGYYYAKPQPQPTTTE